ncbi:alpha/beta fold hydrolase [Escherichia coli]|nr:alpha/beta fold hydrolase [Escherichia coli]
MLDNSVQPGAGNGEPVTAEVLAQRQAEEAIRRETERRADEIVRKMAENKPDLPDGKTEQAVREIAGQERAFTEAGFATITFDYRGFGESDGERGRLVPAMQTEDIISVINWAEEQECIDNQRIGLWGTSLGGGMCSVQLRKTNA